MSRFILTLAAATVVAPPAMAQMNPAAIGGGLVMPSAINAQAKQAARRHGSESGMNAQEYCADVPNRRRRLGAHDPKVDKLASLCREAGYPTGE